MELLDNKKPQVEFENIHALILEEMLTNKVEPVKVNGYGAIYANYEAANNAYVVLSISVPYKLQ